MSEDDTFEGNTEQLERSNIAEVAPGDATLPFSSRRDIDDPQAIPIYIAPDTAIAADKDTGEILGATAEGTLGIIIYSGDASELRGKRFRFEKATRVPRLLQSDILLNFHVAEIGYHESLQASNFKALPNLLGAIDFYRLEKALPLNRPPEGMLIVESPRGSNTPPAALATPPAYVGFYLSPTSHYKICLVTERGVWPKSLANLLKAKGTDASTLFYAIGNQSESQEKKNFSQLLFLPELTPPAGGDDMTDAAGLRIISRETLDTEYAAKREIGGWWFNLSVAVYPWMTANLERLLTGYIDRRKDDSDAQIAGLDGWQLSQWFELLKHLALGLFALHHEGAIHGDPRPANIMTYIQDNTVLMPENFRWIDIGLGYGARDVLREGNTASMNEPETTITPRPLGGGRATIFYAPEREEAIEFEDADAVHLRQSKTAEGHSELSFFWRERTHLGATILPLKDKDTPLRELGGLERGDRVQVREFLFDVEEVNQNSITVSGIYEVFLDRVLVEKRGTQREMVHTRLENASISRYRIFKQWSQATDIYGLGMITLYLFFLKGLYSMKEATLADQDAAYDNPTNKNSIYDRANREAMFSELALLLRNKSFLESILNALSRLSKSSDLESFWQDDMSRNRGFDSASRVAEEILSTDANFIFVWRGVSGNNWLFTRLIYFCLCCVWRQDETESIVIEQDKSFTPFCKSRRMIQPSEDRGGAATQVANALKRLALMAATMTSDDENTALTFAAAGIGQSREQRMIRLTEQNKTYKERVAIQEAALQQEAERAKELERRLEKARSAESSLKAGHQRQGEQLKEIRATLTQAKEGMDDYKIPMVKGVKREFVEGTIDQLIKIASDPVN